VENNQKQEFTNVHTGITNHFLAYTSTILSEYKAVIEVCELTFSVLYITINIKSLYVLYMFNIKC
jgi:hypothetical protein